MGKSCCGGCFFGKFRNNILLEIRTENNIKRGSFTMKNIVILQLESVSMVNYRMHPELFPNVRKVESESIRYSNYYATATSTAMVINDITHSDIYRLENTAIYGEFKVTHPDVDSFVDFFSGGWRQVTPIRWVFTIRTHMAMSSILHICMQKTQT
jgi:hypothetical protein